MNQQQVNLEEKKTFLESLINQLKGRERTKQNILYYKRLDRFHVTLMRILNLWVVGVSLNVCINFF